MSNEPGDSEQQKPSAIDRILDFILERNRLNQRLHWTTIVSEKTLLAIIGMLTVVASADAIFSIFVLSGAAYLMSLKDKMSLEKLENRG